MSLQKHTSQILVIALLYLIPSLGFAQIPAKVEQSFKTKYPSEKSPEWEVDANGNYEAQFKQDGVSFRADFSPEGQWIETESDFEYKDLPKVVKKKIKSKFGDYEITEIELVDHATKGKFYDVEFKQKGKNKDVEFKPSGKIIN